VTRSRGCSAHYRSRGLPSLAWTDCAPTGFNGLTAALINPSGPVSGAINASGCNIGIYYDASGAGGTVRNAEICGATHRITNDAVNNNYLGFGHQAGVSDWGNNDKIVADRIGGLGYDADSGMWIYEVDADPAYAAAAKVHAIK
jgi:hypothetical protein